MRRKLKFFVGVKRGNIQRFCCFFPTKPRFYQSTLTNRLKDGVCGCLTTSYQISCQNIDKKIYSWRKL